jgi:hypothetical protein
MTYASPEYDLLAKSEDERVMSEAHFARALPVPMIKPVPIAPPIAF